VIQVLTGHEEVSDMDPSGAAVFERTMAELLRSSHLMPPDRMCEVVAAHARPLGVLRAVIYLADLQQGWLRPVPGAQAEGRTDLRIDGSLAGRAFRKVEVRVSDTTSGQPSMWLPLVDGSERLGVLELVVEQFGEQAEQRYRALSSLVGLLIVSKSTYSDTFAQVRRARPMKLQAEMEWAFLPPLSFATTEVVVNVALEPAYEVGGDAFDYSLIGDRLPISIFDAAGHDLTAGMIASVALASCRNSRRSVATLPQMAELADEVIREQFGSGRFATALLCELDVRSGRFTWLPCGHPPPLLIRGNTIIKLDRTPRPPLGHGFLMTDTSGAYVYQQQLQPRDRLLLYTDGVTEARRRNGEQFGPQRLVDFINQHAGEGIAAPEALRRLIRAILDHHCGELSDDATIMQLQWKPDHPDYFVI
jgi:serine phosphatase RsbU (regulator of sigma subunit)